MRVPSFVRTVTILTALSTPAIIASAARASLIGVQFSVLLGGGSPPTSSTPSMGAATAGLVDPANGYSFTQNHWNSASLVFAGNTSQSGVGVNPSSVVDNTGANPSGISYGYTTGNIHVSGSAAGGFSTSISDTHNPNSAGLSQDTLMHGYAVSSTGTTPSVFSFNHVPAGTYDLVAYVENYSLSYTNLSLVAGSGTNPVTGTASVNVLEQGGINNALNSAPANGIFDGSTFVSSPVDAASANAPTAVSNYVIFTGVTPDINGNITLNWAGTSFTSPSGYAVYQALDAVQLVSVVPEPTGIAGVVLSLGCLAMFRRRQRPAIH